MTGLSFSRAAKTHLLNIGRYTVETWGKKQRDLYLKKLFQCFDNLRGSPLSGKPRDALFAGMRSIQCEMHVVYYYYQDGEIIVAGVLHKRMEPELHLMQRE